MEAFLQPQNLVPISVTSIVSIVSSPQPKRRNISQSYVGSLAGAVPRSAGTECEYKQERRCDIIAHLTRARPPSLVAGKVSSSSWPKWNIAGKKVAG